MKKFKGVFDGLRSSVAQQVKPEQEIIETLRSEHFQVKKTFRHGFPHQPTAMAFDPVQRLLVIGTKSGSLRILGRPGVDVHVKHDGGCAVTQLQFLVNEGALISSTADDIIHLWNFRQKIPQVVQSIKFQRERITCMHLPLQSKWLYVGTERGNIHVLHIETFVLSGYVINWNKAIEVSRKTHPGAVVHLSDNPLDLSKMLIGYESGQIVSWDLKTKAAEFRWQSDEPLKSISWHHEGKQFMCSHSDGSLTTWMVRQAKPINVTHPHAKNTKDGEPEPCKGIQKVEWKLSRTGEAYVIFSGGLAYDTTGRTPSITVIQGKTTTVLEMEHNVVDFITLCDSPWTSDFQDPYAVVVLLQNDLVVIDLLTTGFPCFENPYPMDLHESPVTCCAYFADCPGDLVPAFYSVGSKSQKKTGFSEKEWPISGGEWSPNSSSYNEIILTGHADGSIKFWDASAGTLQVLYKLKTAKLFEKNRTRSVDNDEDPLAIQLIFLCPESRKLAIAGAGRHVVLFKFKKVESMSEVVTLEISLASDKDTERSPDFDFSNTDDAKANAEKNQPLKVRQGLQKRAAGFQATLVCLTHGPNGELPESITALSLNSSYGLMAYGNDTGLVVVDIVQKISLLVISTSDLGGSVDPHQRALRSPKRQEDATKRDTEDKARSPSIDQQQQANEVSKESKSGGFRWKSFKLKRQTSKVDLKIKSDAGNLASMSTPNSQDAQTSGHHHHQQQQQQQQQQHPQQHKSGGNASDNSRTLSPVQSIELETPQSPDLRLPSSETTTTGSATTTSNDNTEVPRVPEPGTRASDFLRAQRAGDPSATCPTSPAKSRGEVVRPTNLELNETTTNESTTSQQPPVKPMRFKRVVKSLQAKRAEARMLSVPNIKYQKAGEGASSSSSKNESHEGSSAHRTKHSDDQPGAAGNDTFAGNFLRRFKSRSSMNGTCVSPTTGRTAEGAGGSSETTDSGACEGSAAGDDSTADESGAAASVTGGGEKSNQSSVGSSLFRRSDAGLISGVSGSRSGSGGRNQGIRKLQKCLSTSVSHYESGSGSNEGSSSGFASSFQFHAQRSVDIRGYSATSSQASLTSPYILTNTRQYSSFDKLDSSFQRSRSSSMSSLENIATETVSCLTFADSYTKKSDPNALPTLWIGTSSGSVQTILFNTPASGDRHTQPVILSTSNGASFKLKGCILTMSFLDCNGALIPNTYESWKDENADVKDRNKNQGKFSSTRMSPSVNSQGSGTDGCEDRQFVVMTSEKQARVVALPSQNCVYKQQLAETTIVIKAEITSFKDSVCLICYVANGHICTYSLPSLRPLIDVDFLPVSDLSFQTAKTGIVDPMLSIWGHQLFVNGDTDPISRTLCFTNKGHGLYLSSPAEIQKFTVSNEFCSELTEMMGDLFIGQDMPEPPKESFFKGLFGGGARSVDREELFGEASGKPSRNIANRIPGPNAGTESLRERAHTATSEIAMAHQMVVERGDKLSQLEERTGRMMNESENFASSAHSLMLKYKDKKWYQL